MAQLYHGGCTLSCIIIGYIGCIIIGYWFKFYHVPLVVSCDVSSVVSWYSVSMNQLYLLAANIGFVSPLDKASVFSVQYGAVQCTDRLRVQSRVGWGRQGGSKNYTAKCSAVQVKLLCSLQQRRADKAGVRLHFTAPPFIILDPRSCSFPCLLR